MRNFEILHQKVQGWCNSISECFHPSFEEKIPNKKILDIADKKFKEKQIKYGGYFK